MRHNCLRWHRQAVRQKPAKLPFPSSNLGATYQNSSFIHMLYLVSTPIGHLGDISYRAVETLKNSDYILCENPLHSSRLLKFYQISSPLYPYHKFNETKHLDKILKDLQEDKKISLISDAGTPGLCDPGEILIKRCIEEQIPFSLVPGPCALLQGLILSGFSHLPFQFLGFLPKKDKELREIIEKNSNYKGLSIYYETPHRLLKTLTTLCEISPSIRLAVARELTKIHEECIRGSAEECLDHFKNHPPKGEIVLIIEQQNDCYWQNLSLDEHFDLHLRKSSLTNTEIFKEMAKERKISKRVIYNYFLTKKPNT